MLKSIYRLHVRQALQKRFLSSSPGISKLIQSSDVQGVKDILLNPSFTKPRVSEEEEDTSLKINNIFKQIYESKNFNNEQLIDLHNFVLSKFLGIDRSLSALHQNHLGNLQGSVTLDALTEIIKHNSGRLHTSWEIFEKYHKTLKLGTQNEQNIDKLLTILLEKLINGDDNQIFQEEEYGAYATEETILSESDLARAVFIYKNLKEPQEVIRSILFNRALELKDYKLAQIIGVDSIEAFNNTKPTEVKDELIAYLLLSTSNPGLKSGDALSNILLKINTSKERSITFDHTESLVDNLELLNKKFPDISLDLTISEIAADIQQLSGDLSAIVGTTNETSLTTKLNSLKALGFNEKDVSLEKLLAFFEDLLSDVKVSSEIDGLNDTLLQVLIYRHFTKPSVSLLQKIEELYTTTTKSLQILMLLSYKSSKIESALDLYNDQISKVSRIPDANGFSDASRLTETLVVSYLLNGDREFAHLIHDGAIMNNIIPTDQAKEKVKKHFKRYGDVFGEEDQSKIKSLVEEWSREYIKSL